MQVYCNTSETFVVALSQNCHGLGELNCRHPQIQSILGQEHDPCNSSVMFRGEFSTHLRTITSTSFLPSSPRWRTMAWRYFDTFPFPTFAPMNARVFDPAVRSGRSRSIPVLCRERDSFLHHVVIFSHQQCFQLVIFSTIVSSATPDRRVPLCTASHPRVRREEYLVFHVEAPLDG